MPLIVSRSTRPGNNEIRLGWDVIIRVLEARAGSVKLSIDAPRDTVIWGKHGQTPPPPALDTDPEDVVY